MYDPYGYYLDRSEFSIKKNPNVPFYEDFPVNDANWFIGAAWSNLGKLEIPDPSLDAEVQIKSVIDDKKPMHQIPESKSGNH